MMNSGNITILRIGKTLVASIQVELRDTVAEAFQEDLLSAISRTGAEGIIIDISGLEMVDSYVARLLVNTGRMGRLMGAETALVGMRPEVAATLVRMGFQMTGVHTALDLEEGLRRISKLAQRRMRRRG
jgi:rsbT antagonist protein RsbS